MTAPGKRPRRASWTNPICFTCWYATETRNPVTVTNPDLERCCDCGRGTRHGIYVRRDPATVAFPTYERR